LWVHLDLFSSGAGKQGPAQDGQLVGWLRPDEPMGPVGEPDRTPEDGAVQDAAGWQGHQLPDVCTLLRRHFRLHLPLDLTPLGVCPAGCTCPEDGADSVVTGPAGSAPVPTGLHDVRQERVGKEAHRLFTIWISVLPHLVVEGAVPAAEPHPPATAAGPHVPHKSPLCLLPFLVVWKPSLQV
jgi:hypothetical protein